MSELETIEAEIVDNLPAVHHSRALVARDELSITELVAQKDKVVEVMRLAMKPGVHYGQIPGIPKPTLLKPGAEMLNVLLRLAPSYQSERIFHDDGHLTVVAKCALTHIPTGYVIAEGEGLCSSREEKYAYRNAKRVCPACGVEAIIKGKEEYGGGWLCWKKENGCGAKFNDDDSQITGQEVGKVANENLPDTWNTVLKMADKRALLAAVLNGTAASDVFTQDMEDPAAVPTPEKLPPQPTGGPVPLPKPRSWKAVTDALEHYDVETKDLFLLFAASARKLMFGVDSNDELDSVKRKELLSMAAQATVNLYNAHDPDLFPPPDEQEMVAAWAPVVGGQELAIPKPETEEEG